MSTITDEVHAAAVGPASPSAVLAVVVLSDGAGEPAAATARDARRIADEVVVFERGAGDGEPDVRVHSIDWADSRQASAALCALDAEWVLVLGAGEVLETDGAEHVRRELRGLAPGAVELEIPGGSEVRLHPPTADAIAAIGGASTARLTTVRVTTPVPPAAPAAEPVAQAPADPFAADPCAAEHLRERVEAVEERRLLHLARRGRDVCWVEDEHDDEPLVTVRISTYDRGPLVAERALASAVAQTYERLEILVVGDACDAATEQAVRSVRDPRIRFVNLPARGVYPDDRMHRWMVAGTAPANAALTLARGAWVAPCDDDDELTPDHVEVLLREAKSRRLELVHSKARCEVEPDTWATLGSEPLRHGHVSHGSVLYSLGLRFFRYSNTCWKIEEPGDWNLWRRMLDAGVRVGFLDRITYSHYLEGYKRPSRPTGSRLHLGCGPNRLPGWTNIDIDPACSPDVVHDLGQGLPFGSGTADVIYSEHFLEHLDLPAGRTLLEHCRRVLRPGGVLRVAVPDLAYVVEKYLGDWRDQTWLRDPGFSWVDSPAHMINVCMREWGHRHLYDEAELVLRLHQAGFAEVRRVPWGKSADPSLRGLETRPDSRLVVEAVAP